MILDFPLWAAALFTFLGVAISSYFNYKTSSKNSTEQTAQTIVTHTEQTNQALITNVFTEIGRLQGRIDTLENERSQLSLDLTDIRKENAKLLAELEMIRRENAALREENAALSLKVEELLKIK